MSQYGSLTIAQPNGLGIPVGYQETGVKIAEAIKNRDAAELKRLSVQLSAEFLHERTHHEFEAQGGTLPEAISQGCQSLYAPGENEYFEQKVFIPSIQRAENLILGTAKTNSLNAYGYGNLVAGIHLYEELYTRYPDIVPALNTSGENNTVQAVSENAALLRQLPTICQSLRKELGEDQWKILRKELMKSLLEYNVADEKAIIRHVPK